MQIQFIDFLGKEYDCLKAGFGLSRTSDKSSIVFNAVIIYKIAERKTVSEKNCLRFCSRDNIRILPVESVQLFYVALRICLICLTSVRIQCADCFFDGRNTQLRILKGQPYMFVYLGTFVLLTRLSQVGSYVGSRFRMLMFCLFLHAFHEFLLLNPVTQHIKQVYNDHIRVLGLFESICHPPVGLAADIYEHIAFGNSRHVLGSRLVAVQVYAASEKHLYIEGI